MSKPIYLVISTHHIGGAEKRFLKIWLELNKRTQLNLNLILQKALYEEATKVDELKEIHNYEHSINTVLLKGNTLGDLEGLKVFAENLEERSLFHYVLLPPVKTSDRHDYLYSFPASNLSMYNAKGLASVFLGCLQSNHVDVLSPSVLRFFQKFFFLRRNKFTMTPGSFVDLEQYIPTPFSERKNELVFLGLLSKEKQADRLFDCIPKLEQGLRDKGFNDVQYSFMGRPTDQFDLNKVLKEDPRYQDLSIQLGYNPTPVKTLATSKVFFSIQRADNYPSKSLLEAMACGAQIVVTDVGDSPMIAPRESCSYIPRDFNAADLIQACAKVLSMNEEEYKIKMEANLAFVRSHFSIEKSLNYFEQLYQGT